MVVILLLSIFHSLFGSPPGVIFNYGATPRSLALGKAFVGLSDDQEASYFNPAGLFQLQEQEIKLAHSTLYGANLEYFGFAVPTQKFGTFSFSFFSLHSSGIEARTIKNELAKKAFYAENVYLFSYGYNPLRFFSLGTNFKIIAKNVYIYSDVGVGFDLGLFIPHPRPLSFGIIATNVVPPTLTVYKEKEIYPKIVKFGTALRTFKDRVKILLDLNGKEEFFKDFKRDYLTSHFGIEFEVWEKKLVHRIGLDKNELSLGIGLKQIGKRVALDLDYCILLHHNSSYHLAPTHKIGLSIKFGGFRVWADATPKHFAPDLKKPDNLVSISIKYNTRKPIKRWQFLIRSELGEVVKTYLGSESPPTKLFWDGLDDISRPVGDGKYYYEITLIDEEETVALHNTGFLVNVKMTGPKPKVKGEE